jgi:superfamily II DNA or RNA helicase
MVYRSLESGPHLRDIELAAVITTSSHDLTRDFYLPLLAAATRYDRGVGYFSSGWLRTAAEGMVGFASRGGKGRWVTSPILHESDWEALRLGDKARTDALLRQRLRESIENLRTVWDRHLLTALAWMVADEVLVFRLAVPRGRLEGGEFHDKFGVFYDAVGDAISFNGSNNDSIQGTINYESLKVFRSWDPSMAPLVSADVDRFERLWENCDPNVQVYELGDAMRAEILKLRTGPRPYPPPTWVGASVRSETAVWARPPRIPPDVVLRGYQTQAIDDWFEHGCRGLFEMATGTGKTITALAASVRLAEREGGLALVVIAPYQHLVDQWRDEAQRFGYTPVLAYRSRTRWEDPLAEQVLAFNAGYRRHLCVITTLDTFSSKPFQETLARLSGSALLVADEAHHLGAQHRRTSLPEHVPFRLALSATPDRWFDDAGTAALRAYFGPTVFSFPLQQAIGISLTPYLYHPHLVPLTAEEMERYEQLTKRIRQLAMVKTETSEAKLERLLILRADLLNNAENKMVVLSELIDREQPIHHALVYCAPRQMEVVLTLLGWQKGLLVHPFTAKESANQRRELLARFARGELHALVAMKCLDEGVDVPSTRTAFILASTSNPREFIQRRGRVLRRAPGKRQAVIHDLIAVPPDESQEEEGKPFERAIVRRELQRFREFADTALNKHAALDVVWDLARRYHLLDL